MKKCVALMIAISLMSAAAVLAGCGGSPSSRAGDPKAVVEEFMEATLDGDADAVYELISTDSRKGVKDRSELVEGADEQIGDWSVGKVSTSGAKAGVNVTVTLKGLDAKLDFDVVLVKEDGSWKVSMEETGARMDRAYEKMMEPSNK